MAELAIDTIEQRPIDPELVQAWMSIADDYFLDQPVNFDRGQGPETATLWDAVNVHGHDESGKQTKTSIATLEKSDGSREQVSVKDLIGWQHLKDEELEGIVRLSRQKKAAAELGEHAVVRTLPSKVIEHITEAAAETAAARAKLLFAPIEREEQEPDFDFAYLLGDENASHGLEAAAVRPNVQHTITPESEQEAADWLRNATIDDPKLKQLIFSPKAKGLPIKEVVGLLRQDPDLRLAVGTYLLNKLNQSEVINGMAKRIREDSYKSPNKTGYDHIPHLTSREYTTLLALSMLDGTFNAKLAEGHPITYNLAHDDGLGQHRYSAQKLLSAR